MDAKEQIKTLEEQAAFMAEKLAEEKAILERQHVVVTYNNGGGQKGVRRNPMFDGYNALMATYIKATAQLNELREKQPKKEEGKSSLASLRVIGKRDAV